MMTSWPCRFLVVFTMLMAFSAVNTAAEETVLLRPKFKTGQAYYVERITESEHQMKGGQFGKAGAKNSIRKVLGLLEKTKETSPDRTVLELTYKKIAFSGTLAMHGKLDFDSDQSEDSLSPMLAPLFRPMIGMKVTAELDQDYTAVKLTGGDKIIAQIEKGNVARNMLWPEMREGLSNTALKGSLIDDQFVLVPNREVKVGERWMRSVESPGATTGPVRDEYEITLERISNEGGHRLAHLSYTGTTKQAGPPLTKALAEYKLKSGTFRGTAVFDCELGRIVRREENLQRTLLVTIAAAGDAGKIEVAIDSKVTMSLSPARERAKTKSGDAAKKKSARKKSSTKKNTVEKKPSSADDE